MIRIPRLFVMLFALAMVLAFSTPALAAAETVKGKVANVSADKNEMTLTDKNDKEWKFQIDDNAKVRLNDKDSKLKDLKAGDEVEIRYEKQGDKYIAREIRCDRK